MELCDLCRHRLSYFHLHQSAPIPRGVFDGTLTKWREGDLVRLERSLDLEEVGDLVVAA